MYRADEFESTIGENIDKVFFGLSSAFSYNKFISSDKAIDNGFSSIPNATHIIFVNSQELCNCGLNFSFSTFDTMSNDLPLRSFNIVETPRGLQQFNNSLPRIVYFKQNMGVKCLLRLSK